MISSTTRAEPRAARRGGGFTLPEIMIGASLGSIVLAGTLSAFLMIVRSGVNAANYSVAESQIRRAIGEFSQDIRMASNVTWNSASSITLTVPNNYTSNSNQVTYAYDSSTTGATAQSLYQMPGDTASTATKKILSRNITSFAYSRYDRLDAATTSDTSTKRIQLTMQVRQSGQTLVSANTTLVSASYILRNKTAN